MNEFYFKQYGNWVCGFMMDRDGNPYLLAYLSYRGSANLLDNYRDDRGREFQSCLLDGYIDHAKGDPFWINTTNPTFGGGNYGDAVPQVSTWIETKNTLEAVVPAYDYMPNTGQFEEMKDYKRRMLGDHYPECGWYCRTRYTIGSNHIYMECEYYITDNQPHRVYFFRPMVLHLNPLLFQYPLENESKRDSASWLQAVINDERIQVKSVRDALAPRSQLLVTATSGVDPKCFPSLQPYLSHRCFRQAKPDVQVQDGTADVWEAMCVVEPQGWYGQGNTFRGWGRIDVQPAWMQMDIRGLMDRIKTALTGRR